MRIKLTSIFVDDQDVAAKFYTEVLGFQVHTDAALEPGERWLTVVSPDDPDGIELLLSKPDDAALAFRKANYEAGMPTTSFGTDDIMRDHQTLASKGVVFTMEPTKMEYGGTDAVFEDGCGNLLNLHQD